MAHLLFLFVSFVWGTSFIMMERAAHAFGPLSIGLWRMFGGAAILAAVWWMSKPRYRLAWGDAAGILLVASLGTALPFVIQPYVLAQGYGHSYFGTMIALVPLATILLSIPLLGEWPTARQLAGVLGGLACMSVLVADGFDRGMSLRVLALAVSVPVCAALGNTLIRRKLRHLPAAPLTTSVLVCAGMMLLPLEFSRPAIEALDLAGPATPTDWPLAIGGLAFMVVVATGISTLVFIHLVLKQGPLFAGMTTYVVPLVALAWGQLDREAITGQQLAAMAGVLAMVALVQYGSVRPIAATEPDVGSPELLSAPGLVEAAIAFSEPVPRACEAGVVTGASVNDPSPPTLAT